MRKTKQNKYRPDLNVKSTLYVKLHSRISGVRFQFINDKHNLDGTLAVDLSKYIGKLDEKELDLVGAAALLVVAGLFIPSSIVIQWDSNAARCIEFSKILEILYNVRAYCAKIPIFFPSVTIQSSNNKKETGLTKIVSDSCFSSRSTIFSHIVLFSGGIDSTYSMLRLLKEGYKPLALFLGANSDTRELEWEASRRIASKLGVELLRYDFEIKGFPKKGADPDIWPQFGQFPYYNSIPHGRDILSAAIASIITRRMNIRFIAFGQEKESREKTIFYRGRKILRHDIESREGSKILNSWLNRCLGYDFNLFSPIESFSIEEIRLDMINRYPDLLSMTQSCFWERLCCKCVKCISLYLMQRVTGNEIVKFPINPLADPTNLDLADAVDSDIPDNEIGYGVQIRRGIQKIIEKRTYTEQDYWILRAIEKPFPPNYISPKAKRIAYASSPRS